MLVPNTQWEQITPVTNSMIMNTCNYTQGDASPKYTMGTDHSSDYQYDDEYVQLCTWFRFIP